MKLNEAISILTYHQQWRKGADVEMLSPEQVTKAIDTLLNYHIVEANEMVLDEAIMKQANRYCFNQARFTFVEGAKWYRNQLKQKYESS